MAVLGRATEELPLESRVHDRHTREIIAAAEKNISYKFDVNALARRTKGVILWLVGTR